MIGTLQIMMIPLELTYGKRECVETRNHVNAFKKKKGLTQQELAHKVVVSTKTISRCEKKKLITRHSFIETPFDDI